MPLTFIGSGRKNIGFFDAQARWHFWGTYFAHFCASFFHWPVTISRSFSAFSSLEKKAQGLTHVFLGERITLATGHRDNFRKREFLNVFAVGRSGAPFGCVFRRCAATMSVP
jgi:hypothetical protein